MATRRARRPCLSPAVPRCPLHPRSSPAACHADAALPPTHGAGTAEANPAVGKANLVALEADLGAGRADPVALGAGYAGAQGGSGRGGALPVDGLGGPVHGLSSFFCFFI
jgi:hypothetical protein